MADYVSNMLDPMDTGGGYINAHSAKQASDPYGVTPEGLYYLANNSDSYVNAMNQGVQWLKEKQVREEGYQREDSYLDRLFEQAKRNGVNPLFLLSGALDNQGSYSGNSASSFKTSSYSANEKTEAANTAKVVGAIVAALAMIAAAAL